MLLPFELLGFALLPPLGVLVGGLLGSEVRADEASLARIVALASKNNDAATDTSNLATARPEQHGYYNEEEEEDVILLRLEEDSHGERQLSTVEQGSTPLTQRCCIYHDKSNDQPKRRWR